MQRQTHAATRTWNATAGFAIQLPLVPSLGLATVTVRTAITSAERTLGPSRSRTTNFPPSVLTAPGSCAIGSPASRNQVFSGVSDGARTRDDRSHSPVLYH